MRYDSPINSIPNVPIQMYYVLMMQYIQFLRLVSVIVVIVKRDLCVYIPFSRDDHWPRTLEHPATIIDFKEITSLTWKLKQNTNGYFYKLKLSSFRSAEVHQTALNQHESARTILTIKLQLASPPRIWRIHVYSTKLLSSFRQNLRYDCLPYIVIWDTGAGFDQRAHCFIRTNLRHRKLIV